MLVVGGLAIAGNKIISGSAMEDNLIDPERLLEITSMTEQDASKEALAEIIKRFSLTQTRIAEVSPDELREGLQAVLQTDYLDNYGYLMDTPCLVRAKEAFTAENIKRIAVYNTIETLHETALFDFEKGVVYADMARLFFPDVKEAENTGPLTDELKQEAVNILARGNWTKWDAEYTGSFDYVGTSEYAISIETDAGVVRVMVSGREAGAPDELFDIVHDLLVLSIGSENYYG